MNAARTTWTKVTRFRGDTARIPYRLTDELGAIYNPTGKILIFTAKATATDPDTAALVQKISTVGGIYIVDATAGLVHVELVSADYAVLAVGGEYPCDLQGQDPDTGAVTTVGRIVLAIAQDITQETTLSIPTHTTEPSPPGTAAGDMLKSENLAGLADIVEARDNLGLGTAATQDVGTAAGTVAAGDDARLSDSRTPTAHTHPIAQVTGLADALTAKADASAVATALAAKADSSAVASALAGKVDDDDARLSDARTPLAHTHAIADVTGLSDALAAKADASTVTAALVEKVDDDDARLSDARTPTAHAASHASGGGDAIVLAQSQVTGLSDALDLKADAADVASALAGKVDDDDTRLSDARTPTAHTHAIADVTDLAATLAAKAPLASPTLTGTPTAPTPTAGDSSTKVATTSFVQTSHLSTVSIVSGATKTVTSADVRTLQICTNASGCTVSGLDASGIPVGAEILFHQAGGSIEFDVPFGFAIYATNGLKTPRKFCVVSLRKVTETAWIMASYGYASDGAPVVVEDTTSRTLDKTDVGAWIRCTNAADVAVTISAQLSGEWPADAEVYIEQAGAGIIAVVADTGVTLNGPLNSAGQYTALGCKRVASDVWTVIGGVA
jgi:hypothetical protein